METVNTVGQMVGHLWESGRMESRMEKVLIGLQKAGAKEAYGKMEKESSGQKKQLLKR